MSTVFALLKETNTVSLFKEVKIMFFITVQCSLYKGFDYRFLLEVFEELFARTLT